MKYKTLSYLFTPLLCGVILLLIVGCNKTVCPPERIINNTIIYNNTYTTIKEIEVEKIVEIPQACVKIREYDSSYVSNLVRQIKTCEKELDNSLNLTVCSDDINQCRWDLNRSETKLEKLRDLIE